MPLFSDSGVSLQTMKREFLIDEIILDGLSGEVRGTVEVDPCWGTIERIDCRSFHFWRSDTDSPLVLDAFQQSAARKLVERVLESASDLSEGTSIWRDSAESASLAIPLTPAKQTLADYLQAPARQETTAVPGRRAQ